MANNGSKNGNGSAFKALPEQRRAFVLNYVKCKCNGTEAYLKAYDPDGTKKMSREVAGTLAARLLGDVRIQAAIAEKANDPLRQLEITVERVLMAAAAHALLPLSTWATWNEFGQLELKKPDELPDELWLPVNEIICEHMRTPAGATKVKQSLKISRSNPMLETLCDMLKLVPPRRIGVGISRDEAGDTMGDVPRLPGHHGYPPMPATIEEWERQVLAANVAREMDRAARGGKRDNGGNGSDESS